MNPMTRRSIIKKSVLGSVLAGGSALVASLIPEIAQAAQARGASRQRPTPQMTRALAIAKADPRLRTALETYHGYELTWQPTATAVIGAYASVLVGAVDEPGRSSALIQAYIDLTASKVIYVQHATITGYPEGGGSFRVFGDVQQAPYWEGSFDRFGTLNPSPGYAQISELQSMVRPTASCESIISDICNLAAGGDSVAACAILASSGFGAIGCGLALLIISWWGCKALTSQICG